MSSISFLMSNLAPKTSASPPAPPFDVEDVLSKLTIDEKIALVSGIDNWHTAPVHRLGVKSIRLSDGPNGVRGTRFFQSTPAACFPCGTGLAATWDADLIQQGGALQAEEAIAKGASVILGPTVNMQRSPLGGRGFESFSEDPYLAGTMGAATINGIQSKGVSATIKHYVCNDQEHERQAVSSVVSERALREIYLMPFQLAQKLATPWCYMTSYNRLNGEHCSESPRLLKDILRGEWGFEGLVMSDWFGTYSTTEAIKAGLDLEMPGPTYIRGKLIQQALGCRKLLLTDLDACVRQVLKLVLKTSPLAIPENAEEKTVNTPETAAMLRTVAASGIVLLKNTSNVLPFSKSKTTAVIGPNADFAAFSGGGSASLNPYYAVTPLQGIQAASTSTVSYSLGAVGWKKLPLLSRLTTTTTAGQSSKPGFTMRIYLDPPSSVNRQAIEEIYVDKSEIVLGDYKHPRLTSTLYYAELDATMTVPASGVYEFGLTVAGTGKIFIDGECVVDNATTQHPGESFFGSGTREELGSMALSANKTYAIHVSFGSGPTQTFSTPGATSLGAGGLRIGGHVKVDAQKALQAAVELARSVDQVLICAGLNLDWESEGYDRENMDLPPGSDELIAAVTAANPNTAVVVQSGTPVSMAAWLESTPAVLQAWYGGNEGGNAIADIVFGEVNPSGKLPLSFPVRNEDNPAFLNFRSERGRALYGEDVYIGYRFYEKTKKAVNFAFGHGLSYTSFGLKDLSIKEASSTASSSSTAAASSTSPTSSSEDPDLSITITATVSVTNTGSVAGSEVVQIYVSPISPSINRPLKELKGYTKVFLKAGETKKVSVAMSKKYATSFWDEQRDAWIMEEGKYAVLAGSSSADTPLSEEFVVKKSLWWKGL